MPGDHPTRPHSKTPPPTVDGGREPPVARTRDSGDSGGPPRTRGGSSRGTSSRRRSGGLLGTPSPFDEPALAATRDGKYSLGDLVGEGGTADVFAAADRSLRRDVAIKQLRGLTTAQLTRFIEGAQITAQLEHPNIIPVHEIGVDNGTTPYIAMKRVHGRTLTEVIHDAHRRLRRRPAMAAPEWRRLLDIFLKVCNAVAFAHSRGIIHRDLKPDNVMVGEFGEVLVMDWGLARPVDAASRGDEEAAAEWRRTKSGAHSASDTARNLLASGSRRRPPSRAPNVTTDRRQRGQMLTMDGIVVGTVPFMSPEQAQGMSADIDERSDIYSLGAVLYSILTDSPPFTGDEDEVHDQVLDGQLVPPSRRYPRVPRELEAVVLKAMAFDPRDRYRHAEELRVDIERFLDGRLVAAHRYGPLARATKWVRRHPGPTISISLAIIVIALIGVGLGFWRAQLEAAEREKEKVAREKQREELARIRAEQQAEREELARSQAEQRALRELARRQEWEELARSLGAEVELARDAALEEFVLRWRTARNSGLTDEQFFARLGEAQIRKYVAAYDQLLEVAESRSGVVTVNAEDYYHRGLLIHMGLRDHDKAITDYSAALHMNPNFPQAAEAFNNRALCKQELGDIQEAITDFDRAIRANPRLSTAWNNRGMAKATLREWPAAIADFDQALRLNPRFVEAWNNRGNTKRRAGDVQGAIRDYTQALTLNPRHAGAWNNRGNAHRQAGDLQSAVRDYDQALRLQPRWWVAWANRAVATQQSDPASTMASLQNAYRFCPPGPDRDQIARFIRRLGGELPD